MCCWSWSWAKKKKKKKSLLTHCRDGSSHLLALPALPSAYTSLPDLLGAPDSGMVLFLQGRGRAVHAATMRRTALFRGLANAAEPSLLNASPISFPCPLPIVWIRGYMLMQTPKHVSGQQPWYEQMNRQTENICKSGYHHAIKSTKKHSKHKKKTARFPTPYYHAFSPALSASRSNPICSITLSKPNSCKILLMRFLPGSPADPVARGKKREVLRLLKRNKSVQTVTFFQEMRSPSQGPPNVPTRGAFL